MKKTLKQRADEWINSRYLDYLELEVCDDCPIPSMAWIAGYRAGKKEAKK